MLVLPVKASADTPQIAEDIRNGTNTLMDVVPSLIKALDEVAKVHPFICGTQFLFGPVLRAPSNMSHKVAVLAFKAVYTLETKRRENDRRILALYVEYVPSSFTLLSLGVSRISE